MRITPEAQAVLDRAQPDRLDSLWHELLASDYGAPLLEAWDLQIPLACPHIEASFSDLLGLAETMTFLTIPICCAEWVVENLLADKRSSLRKAVGPLIDQFCSVEGRMHPVDLQVPFGLAYDDGVRDPQERHYLQAAREASPLVDQFLQYCNAPLPELTRPFDGGARRMHGEVERLHLALACIKNRELQKWMSGLGVAEWRLSNNLMRLDDRIYRFDFDVQQLRWLKYSCQEARLLGSPVVGLDHLLLAILNEPRSLGCRVLENQGVGLKALRLRLSANRSKAVSIAEMVFPPDLLAVCQSACVEGHQDPLPEELLWFLLETEAYPELGTSDVRAELRAGMDGWLLLTDPRSLTLDGLRLGMSESEVHSILGEPGFREEFGWVYRDTTVRFREGIAIYLTGKRLVSPCGELQNGAGWQDAERALGTLRLWGHLRPSAADVTVHQGKVVDLALIDRARTDDLSDV